MRDILRVTWTVTPLRPPEPWRHCSHCNATRRFRSTGKFRANAQKQRIDVWLIYSCEICEESWNLPILERAAVGRIATSQLVGFTHNDPTLARRYAFDIARLKHYSPRIDACSDLAVAKVHVSGCACACDSIEMTLCLPEPNELRLDAFLARELGLSRSTIVQMAEANLLGVLPMSRKGMRAMMADGQVIIFELARIDDATRTALMRCVPEPAARASP
jgi:hypothetical protein